jgi:subtilisin family serine protease
VHGISRTRRPVSWNLNIGDIWDDYTGWGVTVGVYDSGIEAAMPYNANLEFAGDDPGPDYAAMGVEHNDAHGTAVAGIIAAEQNGTGTVGIANRSLDESAALLRERLPRSLRPRV